MVLPGSSWSSSQSRLWANDRGSGPVRGTGTIDATAAIASLGFTGFVITNIPTQFFPNSDSDFAMIRVAMVPGTTLEQTEAVIEVDGSVPACQPLHDRPDVVEPDQLVDQPLQVGQRLGHRPRAVPGPGIYTARVQLYSNDLTQPLATIPVTMRVTDVANQATISGRVLNAETGEPVRGSVALVLEENIGTAVPTDADGIEDRTDVDVFLVAVAARSCSC